MQQGVFPLRIGLGSHLFQPVQQTQAFGHAPGLGDAAVGQMRRVSVEYLGDAPDTGAAQMAAEEGRQGMQQVARRAFLIPGRPQQGIAVSAQKPGPDRALMVGFVTLSGPASS